jgi:peptidoglycan/LPS O-acetylase OafA/YrhL
MLTRRRVVAIVVNVAILALVGIVGLRVVGGEPSPPQRVPELNLMQLALGVLLIAFLISGARDRIGRIVALLLLVSTAAVIVADLFAGLEPVRYLSWVLLVAVGLLLLREADRRKDAPAS